MLRIISIIFMVVVGLISSSCEREKSPANVEGHYEWSHSTVSSVNNYGISVFTEHSPQTSNERRAIVIEQKHFHYYVDGELQASHKLSGAAEHKYQVFLVFKDGDDNINFTINWSSGILSTQYALPEDEFPTALNYFQKVN